MIKIDINSKEFQEELQKTKEFTDEVCANRGWTYNSSNEINESVIMGLTRNKLIYGKRYCPCFMVTNETKEKQKEANNRICPCKPAINTEIPIDGKCHCDIFCTEQYIQDRKIQKEATIVAHTHSRGLTKKECKAILSHEQLDADEIVALLEARSLGIIEFNLVDVRERMEWHQQRIVGTDYLIPTTSFYAQLEQIEDQKNKPTVLYCLTGNRSAYCQRVMLDMGWKHVSNFIYGIITYNGDVISGDE